MSALAKFIAELKRREVFRAGVAYMIIAWLIVQVASLLLETFSAPLWIMQSLVVVLAVGFPVTLVLAWIYEVTTHGIKRTKDVSESDPQTVPEGRRIEFIIIGVLLVALFASFYINSLTDNEDLDSMAVDKSIAVLPFTDMSPNKTENYIAQGFHDDLLTMLTRLEGLRVIGRTTVERLDTSASVREIGEILDVGTVMEGSIQRSGDRIRVNVQLLNAADEGHLWAETYDRKLTNAFQVQSEIGQAVVEELRVVFTVEESIPTPSQQTENTEAYLLVLQGRDYLRRSRGEKNLTTATSLFNQALESDPQYASAYAGLCEVNLAWYHLTSDGDYFSQGEQACFRALTFDDRLPEVRVALGDLYLASGQYQKAQTEFSQALKLVPSLVGAQIGLGYSYERLGDTEKAVTTLQKAVTQHPTDWNALMAISDLLYEKERYDEAVEFGERLTLLTPNNATSHIQLGSIEYMRNNYEGALAAWKRSLELNPTRAAFTNTGLMHYYLGNFEQAVELQLKAIDIAPEDHRAWGRLAESYRFLPGQKQASEDAYLTALSRAQEAAKINANDWYLKAHIALYHANLGEETDARQVMQSAINIAPTEADVYYYSALVEQVLGDRNRLFADLKKAIELGFSRSMIANDPDLKSLRDTERFQALLQDDAG